MLERLYGKDQLFGFQGRIWSNLTPCTLTHLHRQTDDLTSAQLLDTMREGQAPDLARLDSRVGQAPEAAVRLVASNRQAEAINREVLDALPGQRLSQCRTGTGRIRRRCPRTTSCTTSAFRRSCSGFPRPLPMRPRFRRSAGPGRPSERQKTGADHPHPPPLHPTVAGNVSGGAREASR